MKSLPIFLLLTITLFAQPLDLNVLGEHVILMNAKNSAILFEKKSREKCHPASTTKIATAIYALHLKSEDLDSKMVTKADSIRSITPQAKKQSNYRSPPHWLETDGGHIGLKKGEEMPYGDLLHALLIASANDAANVIAQDLGGTIPQFMEGMNQYLQEIGCKNTHFLNPHGLTHPQHLTTAYDLALMAKEGMKHALFREIVAKPAYTCPETNLEYKRYFLQTNKLIRNSPYFYSKAIGLKTGTTQAAGKNLVAAAEEDGRLLIGVFMGYRGVGDLYLDAKKVFEAAFQEPLMRKTVLQKGKQKIEKKVKGKVLHTYLEEDLYYDYYPSEESSIRLFISWKRLKTPIAKGEAVAQLEIVDSNHHTLEKATLFAYDSVSSNDHIFKILILGTVILFLIFKGRLLLTKNR